MTKTIKIEGMMCEHCVAHVKDALTSLGVQADVTLADGKATVHGDTLDDTKLTEAVEHAGYKVTGIE